MTKPRDHRHEELAEFLRTRRARLSPADVGIAATARRRTPGLRREEVAQLAGISSTWYTWLEQGRNVRPSKQVVDCLARVLRLSEAEHAHLTALARREAAGLHPPVASGLVQLVKSLDAPAYVRDQASNFLGWNDAASAMFGDFEIECRGWPNFLAYLFLSARARIAFVDWDEVASRSVAQFRRHSAAPGTNDEETHALVERLCRQSEEFVEMWERYVVTEYFVGTRLLAHPHVGSMTFNYATLASYDGGAPWVTLYTPASRTDEVKLNTVLREHGPNSTKVA
jgi:transcriptional regulator with XRE-family HTH domain